jgi:hypothetical protein
MLTVGGIKVVGVVLAELLHHGYPEQEWLIQLLDLQLHMRLEEPAKPGIQFQQ